MAQVLRHAMREELRASVGIAARDPGVAEAMREQQVQDVVRGLWARSVGSGSIVRPV